MNNAERKQARKSEEAEVLLIAARYDQFSLNELWGENKWMNYGRLSRLLLQWWRDGLLLRWENGHWREGYFFSKVDRLDRKALYKWV
jgi:hypothetical protein